MPVSVAERIGRAQERREASGVAVENPRHCTEISTGSPRILLARFDSNGEPVLGGCYWARRVVGERARQVRRSVEVERHGPVGARRVDRK